MTAGTVSRASLSVPGRPENVHAARVFTSETLGGGHPCETDAVLLVSEIVTNSILHSDSRLPGGTVAVTVTSTAGTARVEVQDAGGPTLPFLKQEPGVPEGGHGLHLVNRLAARWGYLCNAAGLVTWFEVCAEPPS